jgi:hypothetical protein
LNPGIMDWPGTVEGNGDLGRRKPAEVRVKAR